MNQLAGTDQRIDGHDATLAPRKAAMGKFCKLRDGARAENIECLVEPRVDYTLRKEQESMQLGGRCLEHDRNLGLQSGGKVRNFASISEDCLETVGLRPARLHE